MPSATKEVDGFDSLFQALDRLFETDLEKLPSALRDRVEREYHPWSWNALTPAHRRSIAVQSDGLQNPALEEQRAELWQLATQLSELKIQRHQWEAIPAPTASDLAIKVAKLDELDRAASTVEALLRQQSGTVIEAKETPNERRTRLLVRKQELRDSGERAFLKILAMEEGLSIARIKQLTAKSSPTSSKKNSASWFTTILPKR